MRDSMLPSIRTPEADALPVLYSGHAAFTEPFECFLCSRMTRPPKMKAGDPGMEGTLSYGGRGCCNTCYSGRNDPAKMARAAAIKAQNQANAQQALEGYLRRRRERLAARRVPVVQSRTGGLRSVKLAPVMARRTAPVRMARRAPQRMAA